MDFMMAIGNANQAAIIFASITNKLQNPHNSTDFTMTIGNSCLQFFKIGKGASGARGDDTKSLKSAILNWISLKGAAIQPPLHRNSKVDHGFNHELTSSLLCPTGLDWHDTETREKLHSGEILVCRDQWPIFLYPNHTYDTEDPQCSLLRSCLLTCAYKHVFMSPSSVDKDPKAT
ncbi:hypothetical protein F4604DRAFT_1687555 [Suillus subluteus]|nr:hypothetical protein F4604DRAFT_1687555 [Suillus subluteus]